MKLFYQLSPEEQDLAVNHCADLVVSNASENGLQIEPIDDESGHDLKRQLDEVFANLDDADFKTKEEKVDFLMKQEIFADTAYELAQEMAQNAFYHAPDELVIYTDTLLTDEILPGSQCDDEDCEEDHGEVSTDDAAIEEARIRKNNNMLN